MPNKSLRSMLLALLCGLMIALLAACGGSAEPVAATEASTEPPASAGTEPVHEAEPEPAPEPEPEPEEVSFMELQEFFGEIAFANSEKVEIRFYLTADLQQITQIDFSVGSLRLSPQNSGSGVESVDINDAEMTRTGEFAVTEGKTSSDSFFIYELTVTPVCIYGTIYIEMEQEGEMMVNEPVYMVIPNVTTPSDIPAEILQKMGSV